MKMNEQEICQYIEEWVNSYYQQWWDYQQYINPDRHAPFGVYSIEGGSHIMDIIENILCNIGYHLQVPEGKHLLPSMFSSPRQLMSYLAWFRDYAEEEMEFLRNIPEKYQDREEVHEVYKMLNHVYEMADYCIDAYSNPLLDESYGQLCKNMKESLEKENVDEFIDALKSVYISIPYPIHKEKVDEGHFHSIAHAVLYQLGFRVCSELANNLGRLDMLIDMKKIVYIFEFKYSAEGRNKCAEAIRQIKKKQYANQYLARGIKVIGVGVTFGQEAKNIIKHKAVQLEKEIIVKT